MKGKYFFSSDGFKYYEVLNNTAQGEYICSVLETCHPDYREGVYEERLTKEELASEFIEVTEGEYMRAKLISHSCMNPQEVIVELIGE